MDKSELFKQIIRKKSIPAGLPPDYEFSFQTVFDILEPSYCCCLCAFEHEYFDYIDDNGCINEPLFEQLAKSIQEGHCPHTASVPKEYWKETMVYAIHMATALDLHDVTKAIASDWKRDFSSKSGLFRLHPYVIAVLKNNYKALNILTKARLPGQPSCLDSILHATRGNDSTVLVAEQSLLELSIKKRNTTMFNTLLHSLQSDSIYIFDSAWSKICEQVIKNNLVDMLDALLTWNKTKQHCFKNKRRLGSFYYRLLDHLAIPELAIIYNRPDLLRNFLQISTTYVDIAPIKDRLSENCLILRRTECQKVLSNFSVRKLSRKIDVPISKQMARLIDLLQLYQLSKEEIVQAMARSPKVCRKINLTYDYIDSNSSTIGTIHKGLSPLQSYLFMNKSPDINVVKAMIALGADIDQRFTYQLDLVVRNFEDEDDVVTDLQGKTILAHIVSYEGSYKRDFRKLVETLLYENTSLAHNNTVVALGLQRYICSVKKPSTYVRYRRRRCGTCAHLERNLESYQRCIQEGRYVMDCNEHWRLGENNLGNSALKFTVPLLIEAGFPYSATDLNQALLNELPDGPMKAYLGMCLTEPRSLMLSCRDALRKHFPNRLIHEFVAVADMPQKIKDILLLKPLLKTLFEDA